MIVTSVFHVSSNLAMLVIPLPIIITARLPFGQKAALCVVFGIAAVDVLLAALNRYFNFTMPDDYIFLVWYNAEASTAVMLANMSFLWTLLRTVFKLSSWGGAGAGAPVADQRRPANAPIPMDDLPRRRPVRDQDADLLEDSPVTSFVEAGDNEGADGMTDAEDGEAQAGVREIV